MKCYLLVDFGSTYTKITIVDVENEEVLLTSKDITTIEDDIMNGYNNAYAKIADQVEELNIEFVSKLGCSSAAGGLKMVAIGLVPELTSEAAKRAALGAGAKILAMYSYELTDEDVEEILELEPEIILFSGGTDGGNQKVIIENAKTLARYDIKAPIVIACNKSAQKSVANVFEKANFNFTRTENVMPKINSLNVEPVRDIIREIFMGNIVHAKGLDKAVEYIGDVLMPTPAAVLQAASLLSKGTDLEDGLDDLVVIDIGGATTDIHSLCVGYPTKGGITMKGLEEPFAKRSVEGDLGMRYSVQAAYAAAGYRRFAKYDRNSLTKEQIEADIYERHTNIRFVPQTKNEKDFDANIAKVCTDIAMERHAGYVEQSYSPYGAMFAQYGKDLTAVKYLIGTGGVLIHSNEPKAILEAGCFDQENPDALKPLKPKFLLDESYILSAMGLLATEMPDTAIRIMKKYMINLK
ncbi:methylaspartate mutase accessory protein GlmL [Mycoplasma sp. P36-A1]|uniref:methylaspartate mutase accessory protein GlmL n=1 Tax=Mycoplasma sp. P36-A1 TaxID=3252900 RepID=UPI003C2C48BE